VLGLKFKIEINKLDILKQNSLNNKSIREYQSLSLFRVSFSLDFIVLRNIYLIQVLILIDLECLHLLFFRVREILVKIIN
jgi:hypothetical protein